MGLQYSSIGRTKVLYIFTNISGSKNSKDLLISPNRRLALPETVDAWS